ncbi:O-antigen ligase family protein [Billgrantia sp. C5P2]|uniref:O-antigen ligase family protein n=1 Tax=Billgrantia sp. C5P2 TaxID=3436239 RepID=UPI003DA4FFAF
MAGFKPAFFMLQVDFFRLVLILFFLLSFGFCGWCWRDQFAGKLISSCNDGKILCCTILVMALLAVLLSPAPFVAFLELSYIVGLLVSSWLVSFASIKIKSLIAWRVIGGLLILLILMHSVYAMDIISLRHAFMTRHDATPGFSHDRLFSDLAAGVIPLAVLYSVSRRRLSVSAICLSVPPLAVWWYLLFISEGRSGILSLVLAGLVVAVLYRKAVLIPIFVLLLSSVVGLVGWFIFNPMVKRSSGEVFQRDIRSGSGRWELWRDAISYASDNFPFGIGPMQYAGDGIMRGGSAHNLILNTAAEWGAVLAVILVAVLVKGGLEVLRRAVVLPDAEKPIYACLIMSFFAVMINLQFSGAHIAPSSALVIIVSAGFVFGYRGEEMNYAPHLKMQYRSYGAIAWAGVMLVLAYLFYAGLEMYWLSLDSQLLCMQQEGRLHLFPRFWAQGRLECMQMVAPDHWLFWSWR